MNDLYFKYCGEYPKNECNDSGYGIYINYKYMEKHNIGNYVKFQSWNGESSGKSSQLFYTLLNLEYELLKEQARRDFLFQNKKRKRTVKRELFNFRQSLLLEK
jgi:hypothetical protein